jgi:hypothetical protein
MRRQPHLVNRRAPRRARALLRPFRPFSTPFRAFSQIRVALAQIQTPHRKKQLISTGQSKPDRYRSLRHTDRSNTAVSPPAASSAIDGSIG